MRRSTFLPCRWQWARTADGELFRRQQLRYGHRHCLGHRYGSQLHGRRYCRVSHTWRDQRQHFIDYRDAERKLHRQRDAHGCDYIQSDRRSGPTHVELRLDQPGKHHRHQRRDSHPHHLHHGCDQRCSRISRAPPESSGTPLAARPWPSSCSSAFRLGVVVGGRGLARSFS